MFIKQSKFILCICIILTCCFWSFYNYNNNFPGTGDGPFTSLVTELTENITEGDVIRSIYNIAAKYRLKASAKNTYVL